MDIVYTIWNLFKRDGSPVCCVFSFLVSYFLTAKRSEMPQAQRLHMSAPMKFTKITNTFWHIAFGSIFIEVNSYLSSTDRINIEINTWVRGEWNKKYFCNFGISPSILRGVSDIELNRFLLRLMSLFIYLSFYFVFIFRDVLSTSLFYEVPFVVLIWLGSENLRSSLTNPYHLFIVKLIKANAIHCRMDSYLK